MVRARVRIRNNFVDPYTDQNPPGPVHGSPTKKSSLKKHRRNTLAKRGQLMECGGSSLCEHGRRRTLCFASCASLSSSFLTQLQLVPPNLETKNDPTFQSKTFTTLNNLLASTKAKNLLYKTYTKHTRVQHTQEQQEESGKLQAGMMHWLPNQVIPIHCISPSCTHNPIHCISPSCTHNQQIATINHERFYCPLLQGPHITPHEHLTTCAGR